MQQQPTSDAPATVLPVVNLLDLSSDQHLDGDLSGHPILTPPKPVLWTLKRHRRDDALLLLDDSRALGIADVQAKLGGKVLALVPPIRLPVPTVGYSSTDAPPVATGNPSTNYAATDGHGASPGMTAATAPTELMPTITLRAASDLPVSFEESTGEPRLGQLSALPFFRRNVHGFAAEWKRLWGKRVEVWESCLLPERRFMTFRIHTAGRVVQLALGVWLPSALTLNVLVHAHYQGRLQALADKGAGQPWPPEPTPRPRSPISQDQDRADRHRWLFGCLLHGGTNGATDEALEAFFQPQGAYMARLTQTVPGVEVEPEHCPPTFTAWNVKMAKLEDQELWCAARASLDGDACDYEAVNHAKRPTAEDPYPTRSRYIDDHELESRLTYLRLH